MSKKQPPSYPHHANLSKDQFQQVKDALQNKYDFKPTESPEQPGWSIKKIRGFIIGDEISVASKQVTGNEEGVSIAYSDSSSAWPLRAAVEEILQEAHRKPEPPIDPNNVPSGAPSSPLTPHQMNQLQKKLNKEYSFDPQPNPEGPGHKNIWVIKKKGFLRNSTIGQGRYIPNNEGHWRIELGCENPKEEEKLHAAVTRALTPPIPDAPVGRSGKPSDLVQEDLNPDAKTNQTELLSKRQSNQMGQPDLNQRY